MTTCENKCKESWKISTVLPMCFAEKTGRSMGWTTSGLEIWFCWLRRMPGLPIITGWMIHWPLTSPDVWTSTENTGTTRRNCLSIRPLLCLASKQQVNYWPKTGLPHFYGSDCSRSILGQRNSWGSSKNTLDWPLILGNSIEPLDHPLPATKVQHCLLQALN